MPKNINQSNVRPRSTTPADETSESTDSPLHEAFLDEIADVYSAEQQITKALPRLIKAVQSDELREALERHLEETERQTQRLDEAIQKIGAPMKRKKCKGMEGLLEEAREMAEEYKGDPALDAVIIAGAQKVEHYEIAAYGTLCEWARQMGHDEIAHLLEETLEEEKNADETLTEIAENLVNQHADQEEND